MNGVYCAKSEIWSSSEFAADWEPRRVFSPTWTCSYEATALTPKAATAPIPEAAVRAKPATAYLSRLRCGADPTDLALEVVDGQPSGLDVRDELRDVGEAEPDNDIIGGGRHDASTWSGSAGEHAS